MASQRDDARAPTPPRPGCCRPRYSSRPLPRRAYRPGRMPRPGQLRLEAGRPLDPERWWKCQDYLFAVDLYNHGYWWECHEVLELHWRQAGRTSRTGRVLQGLILLAAARLKRAMDLPRAAETLALKGLAKLREESGEALGIDLRRLRAEAEAFAEERRSEAPGIRLRGLP